MPKLIIKGQNTGAHEPLNFTKIQIESGIPHSKSKINTTGVLNGEQIEIIIPDHTKAAEFKTKVGQLGWECKIIEQ